MKAIVMNQPGHVDLIERPSPTLPKDQVLLRIDRVGFCGSDLAAFRGVNPLVTFPRIPGHEIAATIVEIGSDVRADLRVDQRVLVIPYSNCGHCAACRRQRPNCCQNNQTLGVQRDGAMCEYFTVVPDKVLVSETLSSAELALVEPLTVGFHAVARGQVSDADTVAVIGCGAIGLGAISGAAYAGARVIAIDVEETKLATAKACGATATIHSKSQDLHSALVSLTDGRGPDVIIEAVGLPACYRTAVEEVAAAGRVVYIGWAKEPVQYDTTPFVYKELDIRGSRNALRCDFERVIEMLEQGNFPLDLVITQAVPLREAAGALRDWDAYPDRVTKLHVALTEASYD